MASTEGPAPSAALGVTPGLGWTVQEGLTCKTVTLVFPHAAPPLSAWHLAQATRQHGFQKQGRSGSWLRRPRLHSLTSSASRWSGQAADQPRSKGRPWASELARWQWHHVHWVGGCTWEAQGHDGSGGVTSQVSRLEAILQPLPPGSLPVLNPSQLWPGPRTIWPPQQEGLVAEARKPSQETWTAGSVPREGPKRCGRHLPPAASLWCSDLWVLPGGRPAAPRRPQTLLGAELRPLTGCKQKDCTSVTLPLLHADALFLGLHPRHMEVPRLGV